MATTHPQFTARIKGSPETIFDLVADMPNYGKWLPGSDSFGATTDVSPYPVCLGTTYLDAGATGQRPGSVTGYDRPKYLAFHQTMLLKRFPITANIDIKIRYTFEPVDGETNVVRDMDITIDMPVLMRIAEPLILAAFRKENERMLAELKHYVEAT